jgi:hypothetical protein
VAFAERYALTQGERHDTTDGARAWHVWRLHWQRLTLGHFVQGGPQIESWDSLACCAAPQAGIFPTRWPGPCAVAQNDLALLCRRGWRSPFPSPISSKWEAGPVVSNPKRERVESSNGERAEDSVDVRGKAQHNPETARAPKIARVVGPQGTTPLGRPRRADPSRFSSWRRSGIFGEGGGKRTSPCVFGAQEEQSRLTICGRRAPGPVHWAGESLSAHARPQLLTTTQQHHAGNQPATEPVGWEQVVAL